MSEHDGLRERKKAQTREALVEAALVRFERRGFEATTVDEIAEAAEVSRRTFFRYFATKEAVLFPDREARLDRFRALLTRPRGGRAFEGVRRAALALAEEYEADRRKMLRQNAIIEASPALVAFERELDADYEAALAAALLEGRASEAAERRARVLAGAVIGVVRAVLRDWFAEGATGSLLARGVEALAWIENGFGATAPTSDTGSGLP